MVDSLEYEERLVAYIDIIGWQDVINRDINKIDDNVLRADKFLDISLSLKPNNSRKK